VRHHLTSSGSAPEDGARNILAKPPGPCRDAAAPVIPASATRPAVWEAAFGILRQQAPEPATRFIHRDFQPFNLL
jgi:hypothetical protein